MSSWCWITARWWSRVATPTCSSGEDCMPDCINGSLKLPTSWQRPPDKGRSSNHGHDESLHASRTDPESAAAFERLRGMSEDGGYLGAPPVVRGVRSRRVLRLVEEQACDQALPGYRSSDHQVARARRELDVLLPRRRHVRGRLSPTPADQHSAITADVKGGRLKSGLLEHTQDALHRQRPIAVDLEPFNVARPIARVRALSLPFAKIVKGGVQPLRGDRQPVDDKEPSTRCQVVERPSNGSPILGLFEVMQRLHGDRS